MAATVASDPPLSLIAVIQSRSVCGCHLGFTGLLFFTSKTSLKLDFFDLTCNFFLLFVLLCHII